MKLKRIYKIQAAIHDMARWFCHGDLFVDSYLTKKQIVESGVIGKVPELSGSDILVRSKMDNQWYTEIDGKVYKADAELWGWLQKKNLGRLLLR